jgi:hypothetical protein
MPRSCLAAVSTVIISGDWEGNVLFYNFETKVQLATMSCPHPGGVSMITAFSSNSDEEHFAGYIWLFCINPHPI